MLRLGFVKMDCCGAWVLLGVESVLGVGVGVGDEVVLFWRLWVDGVYWFPYWGLLLRCSLIHFLLAADILFQTSELNPLPSGGFSVSLLLLPGVLVVFCLALRLVFFAVRLSLRFFLLLLRLELPYPL